MKKTIGGKILAAAAAVAAILLSLSSCASNAASSSATVPSEEESPVKKELRDLYVSFLKEQGYSPEIDKAGDVKFKDGNTTYYISVTDDAHYFNLFYIGTWKMDSDYEKIMAYAYAMDTISDMKLVTVYPFTKSNAICFETQLRVTKPEDFKPYFPRLLRIISDSRDKFIELANSE